MLYNKEIFKRCFCFKGRNWYMNFKNIPRYFRCIHFLIKHGYDDYALYETYNWFIDIMKEILTHYRYHREGSPIIEPDLSEWSEEENEKAWNKKLDKMISLLDDTRESKPEYIEAIHKAETKEEMFNAYSFMRNKQEEAKNEFFKMLSDVFWRLWD